MKSSILALVLSLVGSILAYKLSLGHAQKSELEAVDQSVYQTLSPTDLFRFNQYSEYKVKVPQNDSAPVKTKDSSKLKKQMVGIKQERDELVKSTRCLHSLLIKDKPNDRRNDKTLAPEDGDTHRGGNGYDCSTAK